MRTSSLGFNKGKVIMHLARTTYTTLTRVVIEMVQNALDAQAAEIWLAVDVKKRIITVADNGVGVTQARFERALMSVGQGVKEQDALGRFGLGLISPLDKCEYFTLESKPREGGPCLRWEFRAADIEKQAETVTIPFKQVQMSPGEPWSTMVKIIRFTRDTQAATLDPFILAESVQEKLGPAMRKSGVTVHLRFVRSDGTLHQEDITPSTYSGDPLPVYTTSEEYAGDVEFELFRAVKTSSGRKGLVSFTEMDSLYPVTWTEFRNQNRDMLSNGIIEAFDSGFFEGVIRCKGVELHPQRNKFMRNDALLGLCICIEEWYERVGRALYEDEKILKAERRYQQLGLQSLERLNDLLHDPDYQHLREALSRLPYGLIGPGHVPPGKSKVTATLEDENSLRVGQGGVGKEREDRGGTSPRRKPENERDPHRPGDRPLTVTGPDGQRRRVVRHDSGGLQFVHSPLEGSDRLWEFDIQRGILYFNIRHPLWVKCDTKPRHILHLQEWISLAALSLLLQPAEVHEVIREHLDIQSKSYVDLIILQDEERRRRKL